MRIKDISGTRFGRLVTIARQGCNYVCKCDCGKITTVYRGNLQQRNTISCGCYKSEVIRRSKAKPNTRELAITRYYRRNAKTRDLPWELTQCGAEGFLHAPCAYCGRKPSLGMDRINSALGYVAGNVTSCCKRCNQAKNDMTYGEFRDWVTRVYQYFVAQE